MAAFKIRRQQGKQKLSNIIEFKKGGLHNSAGKKFNLNYFRLF